MKVTNVFVMNNEPLLMTFNTYVCMYVYNHIWPKKDLKKLKNQWQGLLCKFLDRNDLKIEACLGIKLEDRAQLPWSGCVSDQVYIEIEVYKVCPFVLTIWNPRRHPGVPNKDKPTNFENQYFEQKLAYPQNGWSKHKFKCEFDRPEKSIRTNFNK